MLDIAQPLSGDQSLFAIGAREMAHGAVLYRDFWDLKQPGIYDFYLLANLIGGNDAIAVHALELFTLVAFAAVAMAAYSRSTAFAACAPLAAIAGSAIYLAATGPAHQMQVEALVGAPLFVFAWLCCEGIRADDSASQTLRFAGAGVAAGCVLALKVIFLPIVVLVFATVVLVPSTGYRPTLAGVAVAVASLLAGAVAIVALALFPIAAGGALPDAYVTWFELPPRIVATLPHQQVSVLRQGIRWFAGQFAFAIVFGAAGAFALARAKTFDPLARALAVWIASGVVVILAQRSSWWDYQWMLLAVPLGAFAAAGFSSAWRSGPALRIAASVVAVLLLVSPLHATERKVAMLAHHHFALDAAERERYRGDVFANYRLLGHDAALLPDHADVYVFGSPMYYVTANRVQPLPINGWSVDLLLPEQRAELLREFESRKPRYVFITLGDPGSVSLFERSPAFARYFKEHYPEARKGEFGTLFGPEREFYTSPPARSPRAP